MTLSELSEYIRQVIVLNFEETFSLTAEIHQANEVRGHWYLELIEKEEDGIDVLARQSAVLWRSTVSMLRRKYGSLFAELLTQGNSVKFSCTLEFHAKYGLKLQVHDLDPGFTLGELELAKRKTLEFVKKEGLIGRNAELPIPSVIQRIAVISSRTAAGWADFERHMLEVELQTKLNIHLYHSGVQGAAALTDITENIRLISERKNHYDVLCILRGGGSKLDLAVFDEKYLAQVIAESPLPVLMAVGHETDTSIADLVSSKSMKTPTALADWILNKNLIFEDQLENISTDIYNLTRQFTTNRHLELDDLAKEISWFLDRKFEDTMFELSSIRNELKQSVLRILKQNHHLIDLETISIRSHDPRKILNRGYSIVKDEKGNIIQSSTVVNLEDPLHVLLKDGELISRVERILSTKQTNQ